VRKYVNTYRRSFEKNGKKHSKAPKIQRWDCIKVHMHVLCGFNDSFSSFLRCTKPNLDFYLLPCSQVLSL